MTCLLCRKMQFRTGTALKGNTMFLCMQFTISGFLQVSNLINRKLKMNNKVMASSAALFLYVNSMIS